MLSRWQALRSLSLMIKMKPINTGKKPEDIAKAHLDSEQAREKRETTEKKLARKLRGKGLEELTEELKREVPDIESREDRDYVSGRIEYCVSASEDHHPRTEKNEIEYTLLVSPDQYNLTYECESISKIAKLIEEDYFKKYGTAKKVYPGKKISLDIQIISKTEDKQRIDVTPSDTVFLFRDLSTEELKELYIHINKAFKEKK